MAKFEHIFKIALSIEDRNTLKFRVLKDEDIVLTKARTGAGYGPYEFELGSAEFDHIEKILRTQRRTIKQVLKSIKSIKTKTKLDTV